MERPSKKDIKAAVAKLKEASGGSDVPPPSAPKLSGKKDNRRIRKQGV